MLFKNKTGSTNTGVRISKKIVNFEFPSPEVKDASLVGNFNQWDPRANPMKKDKKGTWNATIFLEPGRYEYRFVADGTWENDPSCPSCVDNEFGSKNCVRIVA